MKDDGAPKQPAICRRYIPGTCTYTSCKYYHPSKSETANISVSSVSVNTNDNNCSAFSLSVPTAENRIDFVVDTGFATGFLKIAALVQSTAGLSYVQPYDLSAQTASNYHLKIVAKGTLNGYFYMSDNTFRQITVEAFVAPATPKNLLNPDCLKADFELKSGKPDD